MILCVPLQVLILSNDLATTSLQRHWLNRYWKFIQTPVNTTNYMIILVFARNQEHLYPKVYPPQLALIYSLPLIFRYVPSRLVILAISYVLRSTTIVFQEIR